MKIRAETPADHDAVRQLHMAGFPTPAEAALVDELRSAGACIYSLVAEIEGDIVGHIMLSRMQAPFRALSLAPVTVNTEWRRQGIAARLIRESLAAARADAWQGVFVLGNPAYYRSFGFSPELAAGFSSPYAGPYFMALSLADGELPARVGDLHHPDAFSAFA